MVSSKLKRANGSAGACEECMQHDSWGFERRVYPTQPPNRTRGAGCPWSHPGTRDGICDVEQRMHGRTRPCLMLHPLPSWESGRMHANRVVHQDVIPCGHSSRRHWTCKLLATPQGWFQGGQDVPACMH
jgi:hypothetical protein